MYQHLAGTANSRYYGPVIRSYRNNATEQIANGRFVRGLPHDIQTRAKMRLDRVDVASELRDLLLPRSHRLEALSGDRKGQHSIRINNQWRICFEWVDGDAYNVEIVDYH